MSQYLVPVTQKILLHGHAKGFPELVPVGVGQTPASPKGKPVNAMMGLLTEGK